MTRKAPINPRKVVAFTGAGISAESGLKTFRDDDGLWENMPVELVASPQGWRADPELVLEFYNQRRAQAAAAEPNNAHKAIAELEQNFDVVVITQNVDNLHERAGSLRVIHLHGELSKARSTAAPERVYSIDDRPIMLGDTCELNAQLRPHIVWFGEVPLRMDEAKHHLQDAAFVLVVGTSLVVQPAASLLKNARYQAEKVIVTLDIDRVPFGYRLERGRASSLVPGICRQWAER